MSSHTPGPWAVYTCAEGYVVTSTHDQTGLDDDVAEVFGGNDDDPETRKANAHLTAAAPDLLEALTFTLSMAIRYSAAALGISHAKCEGFDWVKDARAVIAKAKGDEA